MYENFIASLRSLMYENLFVPCMKNRFGLLFTGSLPFSVKIVLSKAGFVYGSLIVIL